MYTTNDEWDDSRITEIETHLLQGVFGCRTKEAVEAAITYARYLSSVGISPENCPVFLRMLEIENHWVIDALLGERDPFLLLSAVQPNKFILSRTFAMLTRWHKGSIYPKSLSVILGVLQSVYSSPKDGYRIFPLRIADVNALGKHLEKGAGQDDPLNRVILDILEKISHLEDPAVPEMEEVALHAASIRNAFFDDRQKMEQVIPPVLLVTVDDRIEVPPREMARLAGDDDKKAARSAAPAAAASVAAGRPTKTAKARGRRR